MRRPALTEKMERVCVLARGADREAVAHAVASIAAGIDALGRLPPEVNDALWDLLLTYFRKLLTANIMGRADDAASRLLTQVREGMDDSMREAIARYAR